MSVKEKTANCKNILQQRYEGLKADSIGGGALPGQPLAYLSLGTRRGGLCLVPSTTNPAML